MTDSAGHDRIADGRDVAEDGPPSREQVLAEFAEVFVRYPDIAGAAHRIEGDQLEHFAFLAASPDPPPPLQRAIEHERERLLLGSEIEDRLAARHRQRQRRGSTYVYRFRLDVDEVYALERRAAMLGIGPSVLARNLVRSGLRSQLRSRATVDVDGLLTEVETAVARLREHLA